MYTYMYVQGYLRTMEIFTAENGLLVGDLIAGFRSMIGSKSANRMAKICRAETLLYCAYNNANENTVYYGSMGHGVERTAA